MAFRPTKMAAALAAAIGWMKPIQAYDDWNHVSPGVRRLHLLSLLRSPGHSSPAVAQQREAGA